MVPPSEVRVHQHGRHKAREHLDQPYLSRRRRAPVHAGDDDGNAEEEPDLHGELGHGVKQPPRETGGEEPIVQSLVGGQRLGLLGEFGAEPECSAAARRRPEEHFEHHDVHVENGQKGCHGSGQGCHGQGADGATVNGVV